MLKKAVDELVKAKVLGKKVKIFDMKWTDVNLPTLSDEDLERMVNNSHSYNGFPKTENFSRAIGLYFKK